MRVSRAQARLCARGAPDLCDFPSARHHFNTSYDDRDVPDHSDDCRYEYGVLPESHSLILRNFRRVAFFCIRGGYADGGEEPDLPNMRGDARSLALPRVCRWRGFQRD